MDAPPFINIGGTCPPCPIGVDASVHVWCLLTGWYDTAFNILTVNIVLLIICCCLMLVCTCFAFAARYKPEAPVKKDIAALVLLYISLFVLIISSMYIIHFVQIMTIYLFIWPYANNNNRAPSCPEISKLSWKCPDIDLCYAVIMALPLFCT